MASSAVKRDIYAMGHVVEVAAQDRSIIIDTGNTADNVIIIVTSIEYKYAANITMIPSVQNNRWIRGWYPASNVDDGDIFVVRYYTFKNPV